MTSYLNVSILQLFINRSFPNIFHFAVVHCGKVIIIKYYCLSHDVVISVVGVLREQPTGTARIKMQQSQLLKNSQSQQSIVLYKVSVTSQPHRLIKTSSMQSKHCDSHPK